MIGYPQSVEEYLADYHRLKARESRQAVTNPTQAYRKLADAGYHIVFSNGEYLQSQKRVMPGLCNDFFNAYQDCLTRAGYGSNQDVSLQVRAGRVESPPATVTAASAAGARNARPAENNQNKAGHRNANSSKYNKKAGKQRQNATPNASSENKQNWMDRPVIL